MALLASVSVLLWMSGDFGELDSKASSSSASGAGFSGTGRKREAGLRVRLVRKRGREKQPLKRS